MNKKFLPGIVIAAVIIMAAWAGGELTAASSRYHHELRGTILKVDQPKSEFTIKTYHGQVVECLVNAKTVLKNSNGKRITFSEVHTGEQAYCHCDRTTDGKHYSVYLLVKKRHRERSK